MSADRDRVAQALPGYLVGEELGRGAYGVVWAGEHRRVGRRVAIKELTATDAATRDRILDEAKVLALLEHPHVVPLYDYVEVGDRCLLVMERLEGGTLVDRVRECAGVDIASACAVAMVTCAGLHHAHLRGVLHRDVKPENLLFSADGVLKVTDFGVAKVLSGPGSGRSTAIGELKGTPAYMAPEQLTGHEVGPPVDIYATGLLLYELLCGQLPFSDEGGPLAVALQRLNDDPVPLDEVAPELRGPLAEVTMQALNRSPGDRFATAEDFGVAIGRAASTVLGAGWLERSEVAVLAPGPILDAAHQSGPATEIATDSWSRGPESEGRVADRRPTPSLPPRPMLRGPDTSPGATTTCAECGHGIAADVRFCGNCGRPVATGAIGQRAPRPTTPLSTTLRPTISVSAPVAVVPGGERKQLTVLFGDVERSLDLQESVDPEEWAAIMERFVGIVTEAVQRFEGTIETSTGEGITAVFGVPLALEDHAQRACRAALDVIRSIDGFAAELQRTNGIDFRVSMALSSGDGVVDRVGDEVRLDPAALGRTAGLAQRLADLAEPGRPYLSEQTARLVNATFDVTDLGPMTVKGARAPLRVFVLDGLALPRSGSAAHIATPMVGREADMAVLQDALALAQQGRAQVVGVVAEAGAGKSRLCDEFAALATEQGIMVRRTTGVSHGRMVPLLPVLGLLRNYFRIGPSESRAEIWEKVSGILLPLDASFAEDLPLLFDFIGEPDPARPAPKLGPEVRMRRIFDLLRRLTSRRSERQVLVFIIEDLHWFDSQSVAFVERLVEWISDSRTLVVTNFRPEFSAPWMRHSYYRQLYLSQLADDAVARLLDGLLGDDPSLAPLVRFVADRTRGNPFFVEEVVRDLVEGGTLTGRLGAYRLTRPLEDVRVPASVHAVLAARIDRLPLDHKALLETAAVIGRNFSEPVLARVVSGPQDPVQATDGGDDRGGHDGAGDDRDREAEHDELEDTLRALCRAELLQETGHERATEYRFWHPLTQEVAYGTLLAKRRKALHAAVAEALATLEPERLDQNAAVLAWHWEKAGRRLDAARWSVRAAGFALRSDLMDALRFWQSAVDLLVGEDSPEAFALGVRARIFLLLFRARVGIDRSGAELLYTEASALAIRLGDLGLQGLVDLVAGSVSIYAGDVVGGLAHYLDAARLAESSDDPEFRAALVSGVPFALSYLGPLAEAMVASDRLQAECDDHAERGASVLGYSVLARSLRVRAMILARAGQLAEADVALERAIAMARPRGDMDTLCWALPIRSHLSWLRGDGTDTIASATETVRLAEETGNVLGLVFGLEGEALAHLVASQPAAAVAACERALTEAQGHSGLNEEAGVLAVLGLARLAADDVTGAQEAADEAVAVAQRQGLRVIECQALLVRAQVRRAAGVADDLVAADLDAAASLVHSAGALSFEPFIREERGRLGEGSYDELDAALQLYRAIGATGHARRLETELDVQAEEQPLLQ